MTTTVERLRIAARHDESQGRMMNEAADLIEQQQREIEGLKGVKPELPPFPPQGSGLPRYGISWNGQYDPITKPMDDGYWTPWHLADEIKQERDALAAHVERFRWRKEIDKQPPADTVLTWRIPLAEGGYCYFTGFQALESGELCEVPYGDMWSDYEVTGDTEWCRIAADDEQSPQTSLAEHDVGIAYNSYIQGACDFGGDAAIGHAVILDEAAKEHANKIRNNGRDGNQ